MNNKNNKKNASDTGKIIGIIKLKENRIYVYPVSKKNQNIYLLEKGAPSNLKNNDLVRVIKIFGKRNRSDSEKKIIPCAFETLLEKNIHNDLSYIALKEHDVPVSFSNDLIEYAEKKRRLTSDHQDFTDMDFITIDPETAKDHDDAVYSCPDPNPENPDGFIVYVAIADVSHYVRADTDLDTEARLRGNSIYLPGRVVPMLPPKISNDHCSLVAGKKRPVMMVAMYFNQDGEKITHHFSRGAIKVRANLSYEEVFRISQGTEEKHLSKYTSIVNSLCDAYHSLKKERHKRGPLSLDFPEYVIEINNEHDVTAIKKKTNLFTHKLIEECMVLANVCAAETLKQHKMPIIYRVHDKPAEDKIALTAKTFSEMDLKFPKGKSVLARHFNIVLKKVRGQEIENLVNKLVLRCQSQAIYSPENKGHFGLNLKNYAHFTSPIRRYADLYVHRALTTALNLGPYGLTKEDKKNIAEISDHISKTERKAMSIELDTKDRYMARYMDQYVGNMFHAVISGVCHAGIFIRLPEYGSEGFIHFKDLSTQKKRFFIYVEKENKMIDRFTGDYYVLGQPIEVKLLEATPISGNMRFCLVDDSSIVKNPKENKKIRKRKKSKAKKKKSNSK